MPRYFIKLAYDGSRFFGWQTQTNENTVQDELSKVLRLSLKDENLKLTGCGRTDSGVHASCFYAHFDIDHALIDLDKIIYKLNNFLPNSIAIHRIILVDPEAHTRFDAQSRTYKYYIHQEKNPFLTEYSLLLLRDLDYSKMNAAAKKLMEFDDFSAFAKTGSENKTNICVLSEAVWTKENDQWVFTITADRFLRNMVRAIVGTLIEVGLGKISINEFHEIASSGSREKASFSAAAHALFLHDVKYDYISDQ